MRVQVTKIQDLSRGTHSNIRQGPPGPDDLDKTGPIASGKKQTWVGQLRRFRGWFEKYVLHEAAISFDDAFRKPGSRLIIKGPVQLVTGPIDSYKTYYDEMNEPTGHPYASMSQRTEKRAIVRTLNSVYEVTALPDKEYVEKVLAEHAVEQQEERALNGRDSGDFI